MARYYWQHQTSGEIFAIDLDPDGIVVGVAGPLYHSEVTPANLPLIDMSTEDMQWMREREDEFAPLAHHRILKLED